MPKPDPTSADEARRQTIAARNRITALALVVLVILFFAITLVRLKP